MEVKTFDDGYTPKSPRTKEIQYIVSSRGCWECVSHVVPEGKYPIVKRHGKSITLSRYVYEIYHKRKIKKGMNILHTCDNRICINPEHLYEGTRSQNMKDMWERRRHLRPIKTRLGNAVLTEKDVYEIKYLLSSKMFSQKEISEIYNVGLATIENIARGKSWRHVTVDHSLKNARKVWSSRGKNNITISQKGRLLEF